MAINKVVLGEETLLDLTADTVAPDTLAKGVTAHDKTGVQITGTMEAGSAASEKYGTTVDMFLGDINSNGVLQRPTVKSDLVFDGVTDIAYKALSFRFYDNEIVNSASFPQLVQIAGAYALQQSFYNSKIKNISFPVLQSVTGDYAMQDAFDRSSIQSLIFPALTTVSGSSSFYNAFNSCDDITSASFPVLEEITGDSTFYNCFSYCNVLTNASYPKLKKIGRDNITSFSDYRHFTNAFNGTKITSLNFPELTAIYCTASGTYGGTFSDNSTIQKIYFPKLSIIDKSPVYTGESTVQNYIFRNCNNLTEIHFGAANQAAIEATTGYPTLWGRGAGNATVYFDL